MQSPDQAVEMMYGHMYKANIWTEHMKQVWNG